MVLYIYALENGKKQFYATITLFECKYLNQLWFKEKKINTIN